VWFVHTTVDIEEEGNGLMCTVYLVNKETGSNGKMLPYADGLGFVLATAAEMDASRSRLSLPPLLLGTIAKACLEPGSTMEGMFQPAGTCRSVFSPQRPRKILLQSRGELELMASELEDVGITELGVADSSLVASAESYGNTRNLSSEEAELMQGDMNDPRVVAELTARHIMGNADLIDNPYVSEDVVPLAGWTPPDTFPIEWYCCPPPPNASGYRINELLGWRTNLERAVLGADVPKIQKIAKAHDLHKVREYCECRILLTKMAESGMVSSCTALLDHCGVSPEGVQDTKHAKPWWRDVQLQSGDKDGSAPIHRAAHVGQTEAVRLLVERGARVNSIDGGILKGTAVQFAASQGHLDCVRLLCERGADLTHVDSTGSEVLDVSEMMGMQGPPHTKVQEKVREIIREFDTRCSLCREDDAPKRCPCHKERYCSIVCQRSRWKGHKKFHKSIVGK
jgi:hypothetical protein